NRLAPRAATVYNAGLAWQAAQDRPRAADAYQLALEMGALDPSFAVDARERLSALNRLLASIGVSAPIGDTVTLGHVQRAAIPARLHLEAGHYEAVCEASDGRTRTRAIDVQAGESFSFAFEVPPELAPGPPAPPPVIAEVKARGPERRPAWVAFAVAAAGVGVGAISGVEALSARDAFVASGLADAGAHDRAASFRAASNVGWAVAVLGAGAGAWLWWRAAAQTQVAFGPGAVSVRLSFE
ncbi:MAG TPA: hypothetical protein VH137_07325, partial [Gemmatimonadales bacterium]|nr:hypothetical protein [Gemmatimonadales bacterium]